MRSRLFPLAVATLTLASMVPPAEAKECKPVSGSFSAVPPASCPSPVGICTHGTLRGGLDATYDFVADTQIVVFPTASLTGHSTITTDKGLLIGQDTSTLDLITGAFTTTVGIVGGTRKYEGAGGQIVATGVFDFTSGRTAGTYAGTICKDKKD